jgi:gliding motility-associated-like protein
MLRLPLVLLLSVHVAQLGFAQDCANPVQLCDGEIETAVIDALQPVEVSCFDYPYTTYFGFTTNALSEEVGTVEVVVSNIVCGADDEPAEVHAIIVGVDAGGDFCVPASYLTFSPCASGDFFFALTSEQLEPSTTYLVLLGTENDPDDFPCGFDVAVGGQAVSINLCCSQQIILGEQAELTASGGNAVPGYSWSPAVTLDGSTGDTVVATPPETTEYTVTGNVGPCIGVTATATVVVGPPVGIANTFTPNDDGINDLWRISGIGQFPNAQVTVFDRWGQVVFKDIGYARPWDGTNNGRRLPTATYFYVIELNSDVIEIPPISGAVTLVH